MIAKDYFQLSGIDFYKIFALVTCLDTTRALIAHITHKGWLLYQFDVKSTFLNGELKGEFYVQHPQGFVVNGKEDKVYLLNKELYGLKQA